jgi:hypothetical protein
MHSNRRAPRIRFHLTNTEFTQHTTSAEYKPSNFLASPQLNKPQHAVSSETNRTQSPPQYQEGSNTTKQTTIRRETVLL